jgi:hypothetical protein
VSAHNSGEVEDRGLLEDVDDDAADVCGHGGGFDVGMCLSRRDVERRPPGHRRRERGGANSPPQCVLDGVSTPDELTDGQGTPPQLLALPVRERSRLGQCESEHIGGTAHALDGVLRGWLTWRTSPQYGGGCTAAGVWSRTTQTAQ